MTTTTSSAALASIGASTRALALPTIRTEAEPLAQIAVREHQTQQRADAWRLEHSARTDADSVNGLGPVAHGGGANGSAGLPRRAIREAAIPALQGRALPRPSRFWT